MHLQLQLTVGQQVYYSCWLLYQLGVPPLASACKHCSLRWIFGACMAYYQQSSQLMQNCLYVFSTNSIYNNLLLTWLAWLLSFLPVSVWKVSESSLGCIRLWLEFPAAIGYLFETIIPQRCLAVFFNLIQLSERFFMLIILTTSDSCMYPMSKSVCNVTI